MEKVRPWCGQSSDRGRPKNRTDSEQKAETAAGEQTNYFPGVRIYTASQKTRHQTLAHNFIK